MKFIFYSPGRIAIEMLLSELMQREGRIDLLVNNAVKLCLGSERSTLSV